MNKKSLILVVDDEPFNVDYLEQELDELGYETVSAYDGQEALLQVSAHSPDVVLLDIMMPKMNGFEVLERLKGDVVTRDIPVIIISANSDMESILRGIENGADDYLPKPFEPALLEARIKTGVEKKMWRDIENKYMARLEAEINERTLAQADLKKANAELERLAVLDGLTQIANRRRFDEFLRDVWTSQAVAEASLVMMDIDHFKLFNDHYGHPEGDTCLKSVASGLARAVSDPNALVARYGGEEFGVVLPGVSLSGAAQVAQEILDHIRSLEIPHEASLTAKVVTLSMGVANLVISEKTSPTELIEAADQCLYAAKESGRNRVVSDRRTA
jgi:diguanylate cyclase (GGDEF)-like protein